MSDTGSRQFSFPERVGFGGFLTAERITRIVGKDRLWRSATVAAVHYDDVPRLELVGILA